MPSPGRLDAYRAKRRPGTTPEPYDEGAAARPRLFVVQQHAARRLHWDLRLEIDGVLRSWAVPQGFSRDPKVKRLAVQTEDHPIEYADFEGVIPRGQYGGGAMIVWDRGRWVPVAPHQDVAAGEAEGKLLFELQGIKLRGVWTLVKTRGEGEWLLIKKPDAWAEGDDPAYPAESVLSGLTVEELAAGPTRAEDLRRELARLAPPRREVDPEQVPVMLARHQAEPFSRAGWRFELKYDGYRMLAARRGGRPYLRYRRPGREATEVFPEIGRALAALPLPDLVLDGEVVVLEPDGRPSFQRLQRRGQLSRWAEIERATVEHPATFYAFDLLTADGHDLRDLPLAERQALLRPLLPGLGVLRAVDWVEQAGEALYREVRRRGLEGIVAKRDASPYAGERSADWRKIRADRSGEFVVVGWTPESDREDGLGALLVAQEREGTLEYAGRVGSGFSEELRRGLLAELARLRLPEPPLAVAAPPAAARWARPRLRVEVRYKEWTGEGQLRQPVLLGLLAPASDDPQPEPSGRAAPAEAPAITNPDKLFWPEEGFTKRDLVRYYESVSPWLLPWLRDRPLVLDRYPDGIGGKSFYQKDAPDHLPDWVRTVPIWSEDTQREIRYLVCGDLETLRLVANLGAIPLHLWPSRVDSVDRPDWCLLDLDPKEAPFADVVTLARALHELCEELGLPSYAKTSGSSGLHVLIPLGGQLDYAGSRALGQLLARVLVARHPRIATTARALASRGGKVYLDFLQNRRGQLMVAPFSLRPLPGAPASAPLRWREVGPSLTPRRWGLRSLPRRMRSLGDDPMAPVLIAKPDLSAALERLAEVVEDREK